ncbi:LysR substrate-binding domain-containing protein [Microbaculum marinum]|uniref:LysR substrate-binding domain-containing protein n=1 Tax=Microbaculum marinum TaxID=1764581 RepID=A0AAW9RNV5_9HYPH
MSGRRIPSLRGLQAFDAIARTGNLAAAAADIGVTPSAVSHRLRGLESELRVRLLRRDPKGLVLTEQGRRYRTSVEDAFALLARATEELKGPDPSRPLTVSLTSSIGVRWLMPRFPRFRARHPDVEIALVSTARLADLPGGEADFALRYGTGNWQGLCAEPVLTMSVTPLCAPSVARSLRGLSVAEAISRSALLRLTNDDWDAWFTAAGVPHARPLREYRFPDFSMGLAAAVHGQGLVLGYSGFHDAELAAGDLVRPFELTTPVPKSYYLVYLEERLADQRMRAFRDWMVSEANTDPSGAAG